MEVKSKDAFRIRGKKFPVAAPTNNQIAKFNTSTDQWEYFDIATAVDGAGAVMNADTTTAAMQFVVDEDNMVSDSATKIPTQQSVKAYVDLRELFANKDTDGTLAANSDIKYPSQKAVKTYADTGLALKQSLSQKDAAGGYAGLDGSGKINSSQLPAIAISDFLGNFTDTTAALADAGVQASQRGDWFTVDTTGGQTYIVITDSPTTGADIKLLKTPTDAVSSVFGRTGVVTAQSGDYTVGQVTNAASVANPLSQFAATTSAQLLGVISDENGTGLLVFDTLCTLYTPTLVTPKIAQINDTNGNTNTRFETVASAVNYIANYNAGTGAGVKEVAAGSDTNIDFYHETKGSGAHRFVGKLILDKAIDEVKGADIASATTTDIGAATGNYIDVTGTTTITGLGTIQAGTRRIVTFTGILTLTHHATALILPTGANITTAAGDVATFVSLGSGNWKCVSYTRANGQALAATGGTTTFGGATFGVSSCNGTASSSSTAYASVYIPTSDQTVANFQYWVSNASAGKTVYVGVYDAAGNRIANGSGNGDTAGLTTCSISSVALTAGTQYWLLLIEANGAVTFMCNNTANGDSGRLTKSLFISSPTVAPTTLAGFTNATTAMWMGVKP